MTEKTKIKNLLHFFFLVLWQTTEKTADDTKQKTPKRYAADESRCGKRIEQIHAGS